MRKGQAELIIGGNSNNKGETGRGGGRIKEGGWEGRRKGRRGKCGERERESERDVRQNLFVVIKLQGIEHTKHCMKWEVYFSTHQKKGGSYLTLPLSWN